MVAPQPVAPAPAVAAQPIPAAPPTTAGAVPTAQPRTYTIRDGDNLWSISQRYDVDMETLAAVNQLSLAAPLKLGTVLTIPSGSSPSSARTAKPAAQTAAKSARVAKRVAARGTTVTHVVRSGETLWEIAKDYETSVEVIAELNDLGDSDRLMPGQRLAVSGRRAAPRHRQVSSAVNRHAPPSAPDPDPSMLKRVEGLSWPSRGTLTSRFGWRYRRHHNGIDVAAPWGTPIHAARDGMVVFSGWFAGYGKVVFIAHGDGVVTVYGHASKLLVNVGDQVKQGQVIANVGCTGVCTGSHLHFEVRVDDRPVDPLKFLQ
jgi:murein DD-endopeptidase MepM/ murein hydrolase activator NlpD